MDHLPRLTVKEIRNEALRFFNLEKGLAHTYVALLKKPLHTIQHYLTIDRKRISNPLRYLLFGVAVYTILFRLHPSFKSFITYSQKKNAENLTQFEEIFNISIIEPLNRAQEIYLSYQNIAYLVLIPVVSLITFWLYKKKYNYAENLAINAFVIGTTMWTSVILSIATLFLKSYIVVSSIMFISVVLIIYLYRKIYKINWLKAIGTMLLVYLIIGFAGAIFQYGLAFYFSMSAT